MKVSEIVDFLETKAPQSCAETWDNVGLLLGDARSETASVVVSIDLTWEALALAEQQQARLLITHHPCLFARKESSSSSGGVLRLQAGTPLYAAIQQGLAVVAVHSNFDHCAVTVGEQVACGLGFQAEGRFGSGSAQYGVWGSFLPPKGFSALKKDVKSLFQVQRFWQTQATPQEVARIGFIAGKGSSFIESAVQKKCDLLVTGEVGYHSALAAAASGLAVIELGHRESERFFIETMKSWLTALKLVCHVAATPIQEIG